MEGLDGYDVNNFSRGLFAPNPHRWVDRWQVCCLHLVCLAIISSACLLRNHVGWVPTDITEKKKQDQSHKTVAGEDIFLSNIKQSMKEIICNLSFVANAWQCGRSTLALYVVTSRHSSFQSTYTH